MNDKIHNKQQYAHIREAKRWSATSTLRKLLRAELLLCHLGECIGDSEGLEVDDFCKKKSKNLSEKRINKHSIN